MPQTKAQKQSEFAKTRRQQLRVILVIAITRVIIEDKNSASLGISACFIMRANGYCSVCKLSASEKSICGKLRRRAANSIFIFHIRS